MQEHVNSSRHLIQWLKYWACTFVSRRWLERVCSSGCGVSISHVYGPCGNFTGNEASLDTKTGLIFPNNPQVKIVVCLKLWVSNSAQSPALDHHHHPRLTIIHRWQEGLLIGNSDSLEKTDAPYRRCLRFSDIYRQRCTTQYQKLWYILQVSWCSSYQ